MKKNSNNPYELRKLLFENFRNFIQLSERSHTMNYGTVRNHYDKLEGRFSNQLSSLVTQVPSCETQESNLQVKKGIGEYETTDSIKKGKPMNLPPQRGYCKGLKTLILDLDETLIHSSFDPIQQKDFVYSVIIFL